MKNPEENTSNLKLISEQIEKLKEHLFSQFDQYISVLNQNFKLSPKNEKTLKVKYMKFQSSLEQVENEDMSSKEKRSIMQMILQNCRQTTYKIYKLT